jgi:TatA/E family protein of Tat protein translocase
MFGLGIGEIVVILFIALIFIGPKKLPELAKGLGKGIREFQNAANGIKDSIKNPDSNTQSPSVQAAPLDQPEGEFKREPADDGADETLPSDLDPSHHDENFKETKDISSSASDTTIEKK